MALAVTLLGTATFTTNNGTKTVTATPAVGDVPVIITAHTGNTSSNAPTDNNSSGTYTRVATTTKNAGADTLSVWVRNSAIASAVSTVFTHAPGTTSGGGLVVLKVTGASKLGASFARQSGVHQGAALATPAPVFSSAALTTNAVISAVLNGTNTPVLTPRTGFTSRVDAGYSTPTTGLDVISRDSGETGTTQTWGSGSDTAFTSVAVELDADNSQSLTPSLFTNTQTFPAATVTTTYSLTPSLFTNTQTFSAPTVTTTYNLTIPLLTNSQTFSSPTVVSTYSLTVPLITNSQTFYDPTVSQGTFLQPSLLTNSQTFFSPTVTTTYSLTVPLITNSQTFYAPVVIATYSLTPALFTNSQTFFGPTLTTTYSLSVPLLTNSQTFYDAAVFQGSSLTVPLVVNSQVFYEHSLSYDQTLIVPLLVNDNIYYSLTVDAIPLPTIPVRPRRGVPLNQYKAYKTLADFRS